MSENYDNFYVFAEAYEKRLGKDILTIIRRHTLTPLDFYNKNSLLGIDYLKTVDLREHTKNRLGRYIKRLNEPWKPFQDNGDGLAAIIADDYDFKKSKDSWRRTCQETEEACARYNAIVERLRDEIDKYEVEFRDYIEISST